MWKALIAALLVFVVLAHDSLGNSPCPLSSPCICVWDKNHRTREDDKRNELVCSGKGLTEKSIPVINGTGNNVTFFKVNLSLNHFDHIPVEFVDFLSGVEFLDFTSNIITELPDSLIGLPNLRRFYMSENKIASVDTGRFFNMSNLWTLLLDNNRLVSLKEGAFDGLIKLNHLTLSSNQLKDIAPNSFRDLRQLDYLSLHNNHLVTISAGTFNGLTSLHTLRLDKNQLKTLSDDTFLPLNLLNRLDLDSSKLEELNKDVFKGLTNLLTLYLNSNMLRSLQNGFFSGMKKLQHLDLSKNALSSIATALFGGENVKFESLQWLNLAKNKGLLSFPTDLFQLFPNLEVLELSGLNIKYLPNLGALKKLQVLLIDDTHISTIFPCDIVEPSSLTELYWDGSPIYCGCQSLWMKIWTNNYMKVAPKDGRLNPKGTFPDWKWSCKKPILLVNKDFRHLMVEQISDQCKAGEEQQWCHELTPISHRNLLLNVKPLENSLSVTWEMVNTAIREISLFQITIQLQDSPEIVRTTKLNNTHVMFTNLEYKPYTVCVEALGWGMIPIVKACSDVELTLENPYSTMTIAVCIVTVILAVTIVAFLLIFLKKRGNCFGGRKSNIPNVSFINHLAEDDTQRKTLAILGLIAPTHLQTQTFDRKQLIVQKMSNI